MQLGWKKVADKHGLAIEIGGMKPMSHFAFTHDKAQLMKAYFIQLMLEHGFLASNLYYAMYAHTENHVKSYLQATDRAFAEIADSVERGNLQDKLRGKPSGVGFKRLA